jgi:hypothetical protein
MEVVNSMKMWNTKPVVTHSKLRGVKMTVYLPRPLKREFEKLAHDDGGSLSSITLSLIRQALREKRLASAKVS